MTPVNVDGSILKMKAFPFSLMDKAKDWLYELAPGTVTSWESMKRAFLEKFFPTSRIILLRKRISGIQQDEGESFPTYYERFKSLVASCPQHQMKEELLLQYFYEGLLPMERQMLDASAGGALVDKTPMTAKILIANRTLNAQQYEGVGQRGPPRQQVHEVSSTPDIHSQLANLTSIVSQMAKGMRMQGPMVCGVCSIQGHASEKCPQLIENSGWESANAIGFQGQNQPRNDPYSNTYNPGARKSSQSDAKPRQEGGSFGEIGQIADFVGKFRDQGQLPSSTIPNPKGGFESAKAILLRSGKEVRVDPIPSKSGLKEDENLQIEEEEASLPTAKVVQPLPQASSTPNLSKSSNKGKNVSNSVPTNVFPSNVPFPSRFMQTKKEEAEKDILETFRKVQVNIPLLDAIKQVPRYAKFLKELCTTRKRISTKEVVKGYFEDLNDDVLEKVITRGMELNTKGANHMLTHGMHEPFHVVASSEEFIELVAALESLPKHGGKSPNFDSIPISTNKLLPSIIQAPILELKPLLSHLKYIFLGENETLLAIISSFLTAQEEEKLVLVLMEFKSALGWTLADIKGISPTTCMHHIFLEEGAKPTREAQRRLNPPMMEVVKKEIIKLLDCGVIYPISDSRWVSPIQCVPKKSGVTVAENAENELVPTRIQTGLETKYAKKCEMEHFRAKLSRNVVYANGARGMDEFEGQRSLRNEEMKVKNKEVGIGNQSF
ncbi:unnamed protein product [Malus baccata var. baccata]